MTDVITRLRIKHTLYTTLAAGLILAVLLGGFFGLLFAAADSTADKALDSVLTNSNARPGDIGSSRCFSFYVVGSTVYYSRSFENDINFYTENGYSIRDIANNAISAENGNFTVKEKYFTVKSYTASDGKKYYAIYDRTADRNMLLSTASIIVLLYICSMLLIALLAYLFSAKTTAPLKEALQRQRDLVTNASHELKTPLTVISSNISVMKSEPNSTISENAKWMESIDGQISRMDGLIKNMLELSKLEQAHLPKKVFNFSQLVEGACLEFEPLCFEKGIRLISTITPEIAVYGEQNSLERLVIILLDNAVKYCNNGGKIGCKLTVDKKIRLSVMNTGAAISEEDKKHVFDRFYRADGAREHNDGNSFGLGLAIAQATVLAHGGTISCHGVEDKGSVFDVILPLPAKKSLSSYNTTAGISLPDYKSTESADRGVGTCLNDTIDNSRDDESAGANEITDSDAADTNENKD